MSLSNAGRSVVVVVRGSGVKSPSASRIPQRYSRLAVGVPERVALEVEEEVAGGGVGQEREAALGQRLSRS